MPFSTDIYTVRVLPIAGGVLCLFLLAHQAPRNGRFSLHLSPQPSHGPISSGMVSLVRSQNPYEERYFCSVSAFSSSSFISCLMLSAHCSDRSRDRPSPHIHRHRNLRLPPGLGNRFSSPGEALRTRLHPGQHRFRSGVFDLCNPPRPYPLPGRLGRSNQTR
jgi:hypothetical protein